MPINVSDPRSNDREQIEYAARKVGTSIFRQSVFEAICKGKKKEKSITELTLITKIDRKRVLEEARKLHNSEVLKQVKTGFDPIYEKDNFYCSHTKQILRLARSSQARKKFPTKRNIKNNGDFIKIKIPINLAKFERIFIDDVKSFSKVKQIGSQAYVLRNEKDIKQLFIRILKEKGKFTDWGGEINDLFSHVKIKNKKLTVAFAFKGKGKSGKLTPGSMGKNGDQIQRLFTSSAEVFFVQYVGQIDESVLSLMEKLAIAKSYLLQKKIYFGIIDGSDTSRIFEAYSNLI